MVLLTIFCHSIPVTDVTRSSAIRGKGQPHIHQLFRKTVYLLYRGCAEWRQGCTLITRAGASTYTTVHTPVVRACSLSLQFRCGGGAAQCPGGGGVS